ncbi:hypothetical protein FIBSPDRAFT_244294 [Athelia psychrophila]|uniref:Uncharacterized protein n=1 Tax=Athelia psychrophila TaxID=1759441 RepID=A0A166RRF8_9AGAM|nr:hypothetical protein FIBSPDRAFT_244294 [Fibularhizoctonia sp. CBS 109695]
MSSRSNSIGSMFHCLRLRCCSPRWLSSYLQVCFDSELANRIGLYSCAAAKLRELWIIPIFFILVTLLSMSVAFTLGWIFKLKRSQRCVLPFFTQTSCSSSIQKFRDGRVYVHEQQFAAHRVDAKSGCHRTSSQVGHGR